MSKSKILVVDDDEALRDAYLFALRDGYDVSTAADGVDGVARFNSEHPDLVFLDLRMPRLDGIGALRQIRALDTAVPIYIVTAFAREYMDDIAEARAAGLAFELASKPLKPDQIRAIAAAVLAASGGAR